jgi:hypothetical protein
MNDILGDTMIEIKRKGILESISEFFQVVVALAVALFLIILAVTYFGLFNQSRDTGVVGSKDTVASKIAEVVEKCWEDHRYGMDSQSAICKTIDMEADELVKESDVTKYLHCDIFPNSACVDGDCSSCTSKRYSQTDRLVWDVSDKKAVINIAYSGSKRVVEVEEVQASG